MIPYETAISIRQPKDAATRTKSWGAFWRTAPVPGKTRKALSEWFATRQEAEAWKVAFLTAERLKAKPVAVEPERPTKRDSVASFLNSWLRVHIKPKREAATYRSYEQLVRLHIVPAKVEGQRFGDLKMADVTATVILDMYEGLFQRKVSLPTRRHIHTCLSSACRRAMVDQILTVNPCTSLGRELRHKGEDDERADANPFTRDQMIAFLKHVENHEPMWLEYFTFAFHTGARVGELAALKWDCVDLDKGRANIRRSYSPSDGIDKDTKTHADRWIDLSRDVVELLKDWRPRQLKEAMRRGLGKRAYVFTHAHGTPRRQDGSMRRVFDRVDVAVGGGTHNPHCMRHTFACVHLSDDYAKLPWVSRQLGHENVQTTVDYYFSYLPTKATKGFADQITG